MNMKSLYIFILLSSITAIIYPQKLIAQSKNQAISRRNSKKACCSLAIKDHLSASRLTVCGESCLGNVTISGNETINGNVNINGQLLVNGSEITSCPDGCITTPSSSTDNAIVLFSETTGKILKQSPAPVTIDETNNINSANNITISGNLNMVNTPDNLSSGVITKNNQRFLYDLGQSTCTFLGVNSGLPSANSFGNTGVGFTALGSLSSGSFNTAIGRESMHFNTSGSFNTAIGSLSFIQSNGSFNTALGYNTLQGFTGKAMSLLVQEHYKIPLEPAILL